MSVQALSWVFEHSESKGYARLTLLAIANHVSLETAEWSVPQRRIAKEAKISAGSVPAQIKALVTLGEIEVVDPGDARRSARYRMTFHSAQEMSAQPRAALSPEARAARGPGAAREPSLPSRPSAAADSDLCRTCRGTGHVLSETERNKLERCPACSPRVVADRLGSIANLGGHD